MHGRRTFLRACTAATAALATAGCTGSPSGGEETTTTTEPTTTATATTSESGVTAVDAGPEGRLRFAPDAVSVSLGDTVRWTFRSPGHNVTSKPGASEKCRNPPGAEPFSSYDGDAHYAVVPEGGTFEHQFETPGEYTYVCAPHADQGMVATVTVTE